jgi:hypothetical protein
MKKKNMAVPGFKPTADLVLEIFSNLGGLEVGEGDYLFVGLLSKSAFLGSDEEDLPIETNRLGDGLMVRWQKL